MEDRTDLSQLQIEIQKYSIHKIVVVGSPGSGKSSVARDLAKKYSLVHIQADHFFWDQYGEAVPTTKFKEKIQIELAGHQGWVFEGHFKSCHSLVLPENPLVVELPKEFWKSFVDYSFRELRRKDLNLWQRFKKILFVFTNFRRIEKTRKKALQSFKGRIVRL